MTNDDNDNDDEHDGDEHDHDHDDDDSVQILMGKMPKRTPVIPDMRAKKKRCVKYGDRFLCNTCKLSHHPECRYLKRFVKQRKRLIFVVPCIMLNSEIIPTRCNNCVYSSQWLYSTCFG